jgi:hypothetical protein
LQHFGGAGSLVQAGVNTMTGPSSSFVNIVGIQPWKKLGHSSGKAGNSSAKDRISPWHVFHRNFA